MPSQVAGDQGIKVSVIRAWVRRDRIDRENGKRGMSTKERAELRRLNRDNRVLR